MKFFIFRSICGLFESLKIINRNKIKFDSEFGNLKG